MKRLVWIALAILAVSFGAKSSFDLNDHSVKKGVNSDLIALCIFSLHKID